MKVIVQSIATAVPVEKSWPAVYADLVKVRLTFLVLLTTTVGFYAGSRGAVDFGLMGHTILGTALIACAAAALNQLSERDYDAKMRRTQNRPLPSGRLQTDTVMVFGSACGVAGISYLAIAVNPLASLLGGVTLGIYLLIYTPLKRVTWLNTIVGAVPGALPPLIGWAAARCELNVEGWSLFAIQFFWQVPHFLAIAWMYRDEYAKARFIMLPVVDASGRRTGRAAVLFAVGVALASLVPVLWQMTGSVYLIGALVLGAGFVGSAVQFSRQLTLVCARQLFLVSIVYLPGLFSLLVLDKLRLGN